MLGKPTKKNCDLRRKNEKKISKKNKMELNNLLALKSSSPQKVENRSPINSETASNTEEIKANKIFSIFDFDDTLFCTKYFDTFSLNYQDIFTCRTSLEEVNILLFNELKELETEIIQLFNELLENDIEICIISNADKKWIENCLTHFLPDFKDLIIENFIQIYSAKNMFSNYMLPSSEWKTKCFKKVVKEKFPEFSGNVALTPPFELKIISIGDSKDELKATFDLLNMKDFRLKVKFVQMISCPSAASIIMQLSYFRKNIEFFLKTDKEFHKMLINIMQKTQTIDIKCDSFKVNVKKKGEEFSREQEESLENFDEISEDSDESEDESESFEDDGEDILEKDNEFKDSSVSLNMNKNDFDDEDENYSEKQLLKRKRKFIDC